MKWAPLPAESNEVLFDGNFMPVEELLISIIDLAITEGMPDDINDSLPDPEDEDYFEALDFDCFRAINWLNENCAPEGHWFEIWSSMFLYSNEEELPE